MASSDAIVKAVRVMAAAALQVTALAEAGNGPPMSNRRTKFAAYATQPAQRIADPAGQGFAVMDRLATRNVDVFVVLQRVSGDEGMALVRDQLDILADAATLDGDGKQTGQPPAWDTTGRIVWCHVVDFGEGGAAQYGKLFESSSTWCAGHVTLELMYGA